jgi:uncharacterized protein (DUF4415 family)
MAKKKTPIQADEYADQPIDDIDNPEWTKEDFAVARPFKDMFPEQYKALTRQGGRPRVALPKVHIGLRLDPEVVAAVKASGKGYNSRVEKVLRDAIAAGAFARNETR